MQKNYLVAIISITLIVLIVFFVMGNQLSFSEEDVVGEAIAKKATTKTSNKEKAATKSISKTTTKEFCGDKTCVDGEHVSCYENSKGECECESCKVTPFSKEFQKSLKGKKSLEILGERNIPAPTIDPDAYIVNCQSDSRYTTGAPVIDAFMMEFLTDIDEETLDDFANFVEIAFCNATNGEIVINITPEKYNWTNTSYPKNFTDYQPFMDDKWEYLWDKEEYADVITLTYGDLLSEEDMPRFYYYWLYEVADEEDLYSLGGFNHYAEEVGYNSNFGVLIVLGGVMLDHTGVYSESANTIFIKEPAINLCAYCSEGEHISKTTRFDSGFYEITGTIIHELGHFLKAGHACEDVSDCDICPWKDDVMSYCSLGGTATEYFSYTGCTMDYFKENTIPYFPGGLGIDYPCDYK